MTHGLRFCAVDLHIHTPASKCFQGTVTPEEYVEQAIQVGMKAIAITDHNSGDWVDRIKDAATDTPLTVFPGVEISVQPGIHILAIFPENSTGAHVNDLLARLGLNADDRGEQEALVTDFGPQKVVTMIRDEGALPVLAHIDDYKGAWRDLSGQTRIQLWQAEEFAAVEVVGDVLPESIGSPPYNYRPAYYWSSDNPHPDNPRKHSHLGIGTRSSLFKLSDPITWEGLRLCFLDPDVRIQKYNGIETGEPNRTVHPVIERIQIEGGFLNGIDLELNPNLNCVIGGRGTGKSTLLELIRYAFGVEPKTRSNIKQASSIIDSTFPTGSQIIVNFSTDGVAYRIERNAGQQPKVYRDGDNTKLDVSPTQLLPLQAYGQKEIYEISQDAQFQLELLDNYVANDIQPLQEQEIGLIRQLKTNAVEIEQKSEEIADAEEKLDSLGVVQEELRRMAEQNFVTRLQSKHDYDREAYLLQRTQTELTDLLEKLSEFEQANRIDLQVLNPEAMEGLPNEPILNQYAQLLGRIDEELTTSISSLKNKIEAIWDEGKLAREQWQIAFDDQDRIYQEVLREFQLDDESLSPDRYVQLQQRLMELEELAKETDVLRGYVRGLYGQRRELLNTLRQTRRDQYELRCQKAEELTQALNQVVRITIHPGGNRDVYKQKLESLFGGLKVRSTVYDRLVSIENEEPERSAQRPVVIQGETQHLISRIPRYLDPIDLADAIRIEWHSAEDESSELEERWNISSEAMRRNLGRISEENLFELETLSVPDLPLIELRVGSGALGYRPLRALSVGQKCTALLAIILLESSASLLVDQPEDDLDNQFIFAQIVETLRHEKEKRQFIIATHNANIPVSGDAELIVVVQADESHGWIPDDGVGSIDSEPIKESVERILEGGKRAFQIRRDKYGRE